MTRIHLNSSSLQLRTKLRSMIGLPSMDLQKNNIIPVTTVFLTRLFSTYRSIDNVYRPINNCMLLNVYSSKTILYTPVYNCIIIKRYMWKHLGNLFKPKIPPNALKAKLLLPPSFLESQKKEVAVATIHTVENQIEEIKKASIPSGTYTSSNYESVDLQYTRAFIYQFFSYLNTMYSGPIVKTSCEIPGRVKKLTYFMSKGLPSYPLNHPHTFKAYFALNQHFLALDLFNRGLPIEYLLEFSTIDFNQYPKDQLIPMTTFLEICILNEFIKQYKRPKDEFVALDPKGHPEFFEEHKVLFNAVNKQDHPDALRVIYLPDGTRKIISLDVKLYGNPSTSVPTFDSLLSLEPFHDQRKYNIRCTGDLKLKLNTLANNPLYKNIIDLIRKWANDFQKNKELLYKHKISPEIFNEYCNAIKDEMILHPLNLYLFPSTILNAEVCNTFFQIFQENEQEFDLIFKEIAPLIEKDMIFPTYKTFNPILFKKFTLLVIEKLPPKLRYTYMENFYQIRELLNLIEDV